MIFPFAFILPVKVDTPDTLKSSLTDTFPSELIRSLSCGPAEAFVLVENTNRPGILLPEGVPST